MQIRDGCNGTCSGTCSGGCGRGCSGSGNREGRRESGGRYQCNGCGFACADGGGCKSGCTGTCSGDCSGCGGTCTGSCEGTCKGNCSGKCLGSCVNACKGTCKGMCLGGCSTACKGSCNHLCNHTCSSQDAIEAYTYLKTIKNKLTKADYSEYNIHDPNKEAPPETEDENLQGRKRKILLDYLDKEDINWIYLMLREEGRRRILQLGQYTAQDIENKKLYDKEAQKIKELEVLKFDYNTLNKDQIEKIGGINNRITLTEKGEAPFANNKDIKKISNLVIANTKKLISQSSINSEVAEGSTINRALGVKIIEALLDAGDDTVGVASVSQSSGVQEN